MRNRQTIGVLGHSIEESPIAIIDFETTGLSAGQDRVVEISVVRVEPGSQPFIALDTLVNPERRVSATEIHGISDADVADAPTFAEIGHAFVNAISGCIVASYNVYFDMRFVEYELGEIGIPEVPPHLCLMYLRPMLGIGDRCSLCDACRHHGVEYAAHHMASADALAAASLWHRYVALMRKDGVRTYADLARLKSYKFIESLREDPFGPSLLQRLQPSSKPKSRRVPHLPNQLPKGNSINTQESVRTSAANEYWDALKTVLADVIITPQEVAYLKGKRESLSLTFAQVRSMHARAFSSVIARCVSDRILDDHEATLLHRLHQCLSLLGWAPGDAP